MTVPGLHQAAAARSELMSKASAGWRSAERCRPRAGALRERFASLLRSFCSGQRAPGGAVSGLITRGGGAAADVHTLRMVLNDSDYWEAPEKDTLLPTLILSQAEALASPKSVRTAEFPCSPPPGSQASPQRSPCTVTLCDGEGSSPRSSVADSDFGLSSWQLETSGKEATLLEDWQSSRWLRRVERMEAAAAAVAERHRSALLVESCFRSWRHTALAQCGASPSLRDDCWSVGP
mmetsp:Transcript_126435/g.300225  ORF Transcript_126435/g.300225 Transcript_126435/m.300225 type:complete len:235 (-) Transcript_126435:125-829(-)